MTRKDLETLLRRVVREELAMLDLRALPQRSKGDLCDNETTEDQYASTKTNDREIGEYKSPAQIANELLTR